MQVVGKDQVQPCMIKPANCTHELLSDQEHFKECLMGYVKWPHKKMVLKIGAVERMSVLNKIVLFGKMEYGRSTI